MTEFEEDNFTRLIMKKKEAQRRRRDEEDLALVPVMGDAVVAGWKTNLKMCCGTGTKNFDKRARRPMRSRDLERGYGMTRMMERTRRGEVVVTEKIPCGAAERTLIYTHSHLPDENG
ncbi:hypothetical protein L210DRAFT_3576375 [Boletus edulis BED1]|uniref:Uncharacterized protein n=1 Tax=Boletus edulis BED1 TaxID=1328754 RepID=A0AAD4G6Q9_BOLED|nr:hypothetical protein L210DRAFT_3576375 [Boletus edulis BED1]